MNGFHRWYCRSNIWRQVLTQGLIPMALEGIDLGDNLLEIGPGLSTDFLRRRVRSLTAVEIDPHSANPCDNVWLVRMSRSTREMQPNCRSRRVPFRRQWLLPCSITCQLRLCKTAFSLKSIASCIPTESLPEPTAN